MQSLFPVSLVLVGLFIGGVGCASEDSPLFEQLPAERTGITFANTIVENDSLLNPLVFDYVYNGAGVGVGDFNDDGRPDLYFAGNVVANRLYLNRGDLQFDDVTAEAGVAAEDAWSTGVAVVDINQDGWLDLYVCVAGPGEATKRANRLYVNQGVDARGVLRFEEQAEAYGLADTGYSTQAAFFDYDRDGDLDLYLLTNASESGNRGVIRAKKTDGRAASTDRLYRNDGNSGLPVFTDVSREAGIQIEGYGLGVAVADLNRDGWPDVYTANDFFTNDLLYVNNGDGTFTNRAPEALSPQSYSAMGVDIADYNNDGRPDIAVLDMLPRDNYRHKVMAQIATGSAASFDRLLALGYEPQYVRNTLQLNNGLRPEGGLSFSEMGRLAGIEATDWSWAPLFADLDNDGWKDLFITNGYGKDVTNADYLRFSDRATQFGTRDANRNRLLAALEGLPEVKLSNVVYRNEHNLTFSEQTTVWGVDGPSLSNGVAVADLDGDGDLDLVTNNIDDEAFLFENQANTRSESHFLRLRLEGPPGNRGGFGVKVTLRDGGHRQYYEHYPYRGYKSTVEAVAHFGLGTAQRVDSVEVVWPDGRCQLFTGVAANQVLTLRHAHAMRRDSSCANPPMDRAHTAKFREVAPELGMSYTHRAEEKARRSERMLLPEKLAQDGPALAVGDVDGNGLDDVFVGAEPDQPRALFLQHASGHFMHRPVLTDAEPFADRGALFFDADADGHLDLYVVSGGMHAPPGDAVYQDRLYHGDGTGGFQRAEGALPRLRASGSTVRAADYDGDGDLDLFVGGRVVPDRYPLPPRSYLLRNDSEDGAVRFTDVTEEVAPALAEVGLVTDALWTDADGDDRVDLLVAGEWMPLTLFANQGGHFEEATSQAGLEQAVGWWTSLAAGDFDRDGDVDYVAGNLGLNASLKASRSEPVRLYADDFSRDGTVDAIMSHYLQGREVPVQSLDAIVEQLPDVHRRFGSHAAFAEASMREVLTAEERAGAYVAEAIHFATSYLENRGDGTFIVRALPVRAQVAPVFGMQVGDYDADGRLDVLLIGNAHASGTRTGWHEALKGLWLRGEGTGHFQPVPATESGFFVDGDGRALAAVAVGESEPPLVLATQHGARLKAFRRPVETARRVLRLRPHDRYAILHFADGTTRHQEFYHGAGYLTQSSRVLVVPRHLERAMIFGRADSREVAF